MSASRSFGSRCSACLLDPRDKLYSRDNEELIVRDFFEDVYGGSFVDAGCSFWDFQSSTLYLEKHLGWSGIGVDALEAYAEGWARHRTQSRFFNYLITDRATGAEAFYAADLPLLSTTAPESVRSERNYKPYQRTRFSEIRVPTITLDELLDSAGFTSFDFLCMDIESHEPKALAGFDIGRFLPRLVCVETAPWNAEALTEYFEAHGYRLLERYLEYDRVNRYWTPTSGA